MKEWAVKFQEFPEVLLFLSRCPRIGLQQARKFSSFSLKLVFYSQMDGTLFFLTSSSQGLLSDLLHQQIKEEARSVVYATV